MKKYLFEVLVGGSVASVVVMAYSIEHAVEKIVTMVEGVVK